MVVGVRSGVADGKRMGGQVAQPRSDDPGSAQLPGSPGRQASRSNALRSTRICVPGSSFGDTPRRIASAVHSWRSLATHASPVGLMPA